MEVTNALFTFALYLISIKEEKKKRKKKEKRQSTESKPISIVFPLLTKQKFFHAKNNGKR